LSSIVEVDDENLFNVAISGMATAEIWPLTTTSIW